MKFLSNFLQKTKKTQFSVKKFWRRKLPFENCDDFFPDSCPAEKHSFRRFLKYLENRAIFEFFPCFLRSALLRRFSTHRPESMPGDNSILPVSVYVLFKNKCGFLIRFLKKKSLKASHALCRDFSDFCSWRCQSRHFVLLFFCEKKQEKEFLKNSH